MKKILLLNLLLAMLFGVQSVKADVVFNSTNFPDPAFRQYLSERYNLWEGETLTQNDLEKVVNLYPIRLGISSLKGIEHFKYLRILYCEYNNLTSLDLSKNKLMHTIVCNDNQLTELVLPDLEWNPSGNYFTTIDCSHNNLSSLRVPIRVAPYFQLDCSYNKLSELIITSQQDVNDAIVDCSHNNLSNIDFGERINLWDLDCSYNNFTSLNLSKRNFAELNCSHNNITQLEDLWRWTNLTKLDISYNKLNGNIGLAAGLTNLEELDCSGNDYTYIILQYLTGLKDLTMNDSKVTSLDISYNTKLQRLTLKNSKVTSLDQSFCPDLHYVDCENTPLGRLRILNNNKEMDTLIVRNCNLDVLTLSDGINKMKHLDCSNNNIGALSLSNMPELLYLDCSNNRLPFLDITSCKSLKRFFAHHNRLISIGGVDVADGPNWENYNADAFTPQEPTTRRFERISSSRGEVWALYLGISDASRILNFKKDGVSASPVISNKYLIVSDNLSQIPQKVEYDFKPYATKNAFHVVVNYDVKDYNIFIDGQKMTSLNFFDIPGLVSGTAYIEDKPESLGWAGEPTLVLDNATLEWDGTNYGIYNNNNYYFTIKVIGDCSITNKYDVGIELDPVTRTTIEGGGTLNILSKYSCIESFVLTELTIQDNTKIIGRSTDGRGYYEGDVAKLEIKDGAVFAVNSKYEPLYLDKDKPVFGEGIDIRYPEGAYFSGTYNYLYYADGTEVKNDWVVIGPDTQATHDLIDGVDEIDNGQRTTDNGFIYNLAGQQIVNGKLQRGINIKDGKKIIKK